MTHPDPLTPIQWGAIALLVVAAWRWRTVLIQLCAGVVIAGLFLALGLAACGVFGCAGKP